MLVTVPNSGTRAVAEYFGLKFMKDPPRVGEALSEFSDDSKKAGRCGLWCHSSGTNMNYLMYADAHFFTTWRDPLRVAVSWVYKPMSERSGFGDLHNYYLNLLLLRKERGVGVLDLSTFPKVPRNEHSVKFPQILEAYNRRDLDFLYLHMKGYIDMLRSIDWAGLPVEGWWR